MPEWGEDGTGDGAAQPQQHAESTQASVADAAVGWNTDSTIMAPSAMEGMEVRLSKRSLGILHSRNGWCDEQAGQSGWSDEGPSWSCNNCGDSTGGPSRPCNNCESNDVRMHSMASTEFNDIVSAELATIAATQCWSDEVLASPFSFMDIWARSNNGEDSAVRDVLLSSFCANCKPASTKLRSESSWIGLTSSWFQATCQVRKK